MSTELNYLPGDEKDDSKKPGEEKSNSSEEHRAISLPHTERAEGPFEHSGETSGWTKEEREEEEHDQQGNKTGQV